MKRLWGIVLLACITTPVWALSPEGEALLEQVRAKCQLAQTRIPPVLSSKVEQKRNNPQPNDADLLGQPEIMLPPADADLAHGSFSDLNAIDPTLAHEDGGKLVLGAPKKVKAGKGSKKAQKKGKSKGKNKKKHKSNITAKTKANAGAKLKTKAKVSSKTVKQPKAATK